MNCIACNINSTKSNGTNHKMKKFPFAFCLCFCYAITPFAKTINVCLKCTHLSLGMRVSVFCGWMLISDFYRWQIHSRIFDFNHALNTNFLFTESFSQNVMTGIDCVCTSIDAWRWEELQNARFICVVIVVSFRKTKRLWLCSMNRSVSFPF